MAQRRFIFVLLMTLIALSMLGNVARPANAITNGRAACNKTAAPGTTTQKLTLGGLARTYRLHIPPGYDGLTPLPLVVSIHGFASYAADQEGWSQWTPIADRETFIVVYPDGTGTPQRWNAGDSGFVGSQQVDDVQFFTDLFDTLDKTLCIDDARIFVNGFSNGGGMANRLACALSERIAAVGMVEGAYSPILGGCTPSRPIPLLAFHSLIDPVVNFNGAPNNNLPPIRDWVAEWVKRNGCKAEPTSIYEHGAAHGFGYTDCAGNGDVQFYVIDDGGHTWPGGVSQVPILLGKTSTDVNASETLWAFYKAHPLLARA